MKYAFIYPGQGSQTLTMGKDFRNNFKIAKEMSQRASEILHIDIDNLLDNDETRLNQTQWIQPAIFLVSAMAYNIVQQEYDIQASLAFGHSLGEVSAYCLHGGTDFEKALFLIHKRGQLMSDACKNEEAGMMVCLGLEAEKIEEICTKAQHNGKKVWAANYNLTSQIVLAGIKKDLESLTDTLKLAGAKRTLLLKMNVASHCPLLESCLKPFHEILESHLGDSQVEIISNATLELYKTKQQALQNLTQQLIKPVLYYKSVVKAKELGIERFIELGNGNVLAGLNNKISDIPTISIQNTESLKQLG